jgi:hypothetical protein
MPAFPIAFGYVQTPGGRGGAAAHGGAGGSSAHGGTVHQVTRLEVTEELGPHGFPLTAQIDVAATALGGTGGSGAAAVEAIKDLSITVTPLAFGPVLLVNDVDGRVSHFPRAMVRYEVEDGREGLGWIEWNQPDSGA